MSCVDNMTIPGTWVPVLRLRGDRIYWNDMDQILSGVVSSTRKRPGAWIPAFAGMTMLGDRLAPCNAEFIRQTWCSSTKK